MSRLTPEVAARFAERWNAGDSIVALAVRFHCGSDRLHDIARRIRRDRPGLLRRRIASPGRQRFRDERSEEAEAS